MIIKQINVRLIIFLWLVMMGNAVAADQIKLVALGDSLTAGYQLPPDASFPSRLEKALKARGYDVAISNAGVSGDTSTGGLSRFDWAVPKGTDIVIVELGANDALRAIEPAKTKASMDAILDKINSVGADALLTGMKAPPNLGSEYGAKFNAIYPALAKKHGVALYPFFLDGVAANPALNLADGIHPNEQGIDVIVANILPSVEALISKRLNN